MKHKWTLQGHIQRSSSCYLLENETNRWNLICVLCICLRDSLEQIFWTEYTLNYHGIDTWPLWCSNKHNVYCEREKCSKVPFFFSVQINNVYIFLSRRKTKRVKIALKWDSCYSLPCSWNRDSHYITKKKIKRNKQHKLIGFISSKNIISQSILWQRLPQYVAVPQPHWWTGIVPCD